LKIFLFILALIPSLANLNAQQISKLIEGKVVGVRDGDTIVILFDGKPLVIRLAHIDCPELKKKQPFGAAAKKFTSDFCFGKMVRVENDEKFDRNQRLIAVVYNENGINLNRQLVKAGLAWHYRKYSSDQVYAQLEITARNNRTGLWSENNPVPPWDWRKPKN
jgi:endonuclease YncB( thermonuclease family)